jgi:hypothetical protein
MGKKRRAQRVWILVGPKQPTHSEQNKYLERTRKCTMWFTGRATLQLSNYCLSAMWTMAEMICFGKE